MIPQSMPELLAEPFPGHKHTWEDSGRLSKPTELIVDVSDGIIIGCAKVYSTGKKGNRKIKH